jgi:glycerol-3-phosphate O-acyltransferase / dihydroxyacetone phosphate acyltransferase
MRRIFDRVVGLIAWTAVRGSVRRFEFIGRERIPRGVPVIVVANHFNGFVDPLVVCAALGRLPRFIAKATLGKILPVRWLLAAAGVVLVQRRQDGPDGAGTNDDAFAACHDALRRNATVVIFPEGTTHDRAHLDPLRTGAARIALGARAAGATNLAVVPVGLTFADKVSIRDDVCVRVGAPIALDTWAEATGAPTAGADDHTAVRALTDEIDARLRRVVPDFATVEEWWGLDAAAAISCQPEGEDEATLVERAELADRLGQAPAPARAEVVRATAEYRFLLDRARLTDAAVARSLDTTGVVWRVVVRGVLLTLAAPFLSLAVTVNVVPAVIVAAAGALVRTPVTKGTVRTLLAIVVFPVAWWIAAANLADGPRAILPLMLAFGAGGYIALLAAEAVLALVRNVVARRAAFERRAYLTVLRTHRTSVLDAVARALEPQAEVA